MVKTLVERVRLEWGERLGYFKGRLREVIQRFTALKIPNNLQACKVDEACNPVDPIRFCIILLVLLFRLKRTKQERGVKNGPPLGPLLM